MATYKDKILEALRLQNGLTSGEIIEYLIQSDPALEKQRIYNAVNYLIGVGLLTKQGKRLYLANNKESSNGHTNGATNKPFNFTRPLPAPTFAPQLAGYQQGRKGKQIMVVSSPQYFDNIVRLELINGNGAYTIPLFGALTICIGPDIPKLSPEQESYRGIRQIRLTFADGKSELIHTNESGHVTIAPVLEG